METNYDRMLAGKLYDPGDEAILAEQNGCQQAMEHYNKTTACDMALREELLQQAFASVGEGSYIQVPFYANWGGRHVTIGKNVYANFNLTLVDDGFITIGDYVMIGPNVTIATAGHPVDPDLRRQGLQFNANVHIGNNVWIGAGALIMPGVTIGDDTVIGAGSVVTKVIPAHVVAAGNPCRILREVGERDKEYYFRNRKVD